MRIAVTGAGGRLGGQVVELLAGHDVVALRRAVADYADLPALRAALRGVDTVVLISSDGPAAQLIHHHHNLVLAAAGNGVSHVVALSGLDADLGSPFCYAVTNGYTELLLAESGLAVSVARASIYAEFFLHWLTAARTTGLIRVPAADGRISLVSRSDVARCLAALAVSPTGLRHDITGPASLGVAEMAALGSTAWGVPVRYEDVAPAEFCLDLARAGEDPWWTYAYSSMFDSVRERRWASTSDEVARLTGQAPASLAAVLTRAA